MKKIYIVLTYSGTVVSKLIRIYTHYKYSHVSLAIDSNLDKMYSFGRKKVNNPFIGGFIIEKIDSNFYKKFNKTKCIIMELDINNKQYFKLINLINNYIEDIEIYHYDILGLFLKIFKIKINRKHYSVCTEFVAKLLKESNIYYFNNKIIKPSDFLNIPNTRIVYQGNLLDFNN